MRKDGTVSTGVGGGDGVHTVKDMRIRHKECMYCNRELSYAHLMKDHLNLNSDLLSKSIPADDKPKLKTQEAKKKWTSQTVEMCKWIRVEKTEFRELYVGDALFTIDDLLEQVEKHACSYQGKYYVSPEIKEKLVKDIRLDPEENRINYRARHVRHLQHRVMDHIFGDRRFELKDLDELARWMCDDKSEMAFFNSRLIAGNMGRPKDAKLSHATIASMARAMIQMLNWVLNTYSDMAVQAAGFKALKAMRGIEKNANKNARVMM